MGYGYYEMVNAVGYDSSQLFIQVEVQVCHHSNKLDDSKPTIVNGNMPPQPIDDDTDTNEDDLVYGNSFSKLIDTVASIPSMYGCLPTDVRLYKTEYEKEQARGKMFDSVDMGETGVVYTNEWLKFCMEHSIAEAATLAAHLILDHGNDKGLTAFVNAVLVSNKPENTEKF